MRKKHPGAAFGLSSKGEDEPEQEVLTPEHVIERVVTCFGGPIALDPCSPTIKEPSFYARARYREADNGLTRDWVDDTFVNPPFGTLKEWLEKVRVEAARGLRIVLLSPFRSNRAWFRLTMQQADTISFEDAMNFHGRKDKIPVPICLMSFNCQIDGPLTIRPGKIPKCPE